jgi:hypothetical protein
MFELTSLAHYYITHTAINYVLYFLDLFVADFT